MGLAAEDLILRAQRGAIYPIFNLAECSQRFRKDEPKIGAQDLEAAVPQEGPGFWRREQDGIAIKRATRHHVAGRETPGIIFPERKNSSYPEGSMDHRQRRRALRRQDVVEHPVAIRQIHLPGRLKFADGLVANTLVGAALAR